uniref:Uncharacterized protein n=1 Tax=Trypanosoma congolense (strain IL3000) TaxID=1068625 RepID=G0UU63_TRYCI|nr:conserved hypothetical protein [Trypanosoma congolense IL3000]
MAVDEQQISSYLSTGDVVLMDRRCMEMRHPLGISICLLSKSECRYDHVAMIVKLSEEEVKQQKEKGIIHPADPFSPSGTYVLETNVSGLSLRPLENRVKRSSAKHMAIRPLNIGDGHCEFKTRLLDQLGDYHKRPYKTRLSSYLPVILSPPDKMDRIKAAHKLSLLKREVDSIDKVLRSGIAMEDRETLLRLRSTYCDATLTLKDTYFPHLPLGVDESIPIVNFGGKHFAVDGVSTAEEVFCTELVAQLWQKCGVLSPFPPASSYRSFDFLDDTRFNFTGNQISFGEKFTLKGDDMPLEPPVRSAPIKQPSFAERLDVYRCMAINGDPCNPDLNAMKAWLLQSNEFKTVVADLPFNVVSTGILFALCGLLVAPLRLRWTEHQLGVLLRRGSLWSLSAGLFARDLAFAATQGVATCVALACLRDGQSSAGLLGPPLVQTDWFDTRHPYYYVCAVWCMASAAAHVVTTPLLNSVIAHHFGPVVPGPWSPRTLARGCFFLLPLGIIIPYQAAWLTWYETLGSGIIPTTSSVLRRRVEHLDTEEWRHYKYKALLGAFVTTTAFDIIAYPLQRQCWRSFLSQLYRPTVSPSCGKRWFAGYSHRFAGNLVTMLTTSTSLSLLGVV